MRRFLPGTPNSRIHFALGAALGVAAIVAVFNPLSHAASGSKAAGSTLAANAATPRASSGTLLEEFAGDGARTVLTPPVEGVALPTPLVARATAQAVLERTAGSTGPVTSKDFTLHLDGLSSAQMSSAATVGDALAKLGIEVGEQDLVYPETTSALRPGTHVFVTHAAEVRLLIGEQATTYFTQAHTVGQFLAAIGQTLESADTVVPGAETPLTHGMAINLTTVREATDTVDEPIAYGTVYDYDYGFPDGEQVLTQEGQYGSYQRQYRVTLVNGVEASRELVAEYSVPATDEIVTIGTYVDPTPAPVAFHAPDGPLECSQTMSVYATWYTAASSGGSGTTATGTGVYRGIIAVDPDVIPLGTSLYVPGYGYGVAADTGGGVVGDMIDLGYGDNDVYDWTVGRVDICVLS